MAKPSKPIGKRHSEELQPPQPVKSRQPWADYEPVEPAAPQPEAPVAQQQPAGQTPGRQTPGRRLVLGEGFLANGGLQTEAVEMWLDNRRINLEIPPEVQGKRVRLVAEVLE